MHFIMQLLPAIALVAMLFALFYLTFTYVPRFHKAWKQWRWDSWCRKSRYVPNVSGDADYWKGFFHSVDRDYSCGAAFCDDPACNTHGAKNADGELRYWESRSQLH
jgi:hypothetical protein